MRPEAPSLHVLVPVKRLEGAKTRLAAGYTADERRELVLAMLADVLAALAATPRLGAVSVVTGDATVEAEARRLGAGVLPDGQLPWNDGLLFAARSLGAPPPALAIVAGDLPLLAPADVTALVDALPARGVAIGRAHDGGTNALALRRADGLVPSFGVPGSAAVHAARAAQAGLAATVVDTPGLRLDLDTPADAERIVAAGGGSRAVRLLEDYRKRSSPGSRTSSAAVPSPSAP